MTRVLHVGLGFIYNEAAISCSNKTCSLSMEKLIHFILLFTYFVFDSDRVIAFYTPIV